MPKYSGGSYTITTFDPYGSKIQTARCKNATDCIAQGRDLVARGDASSFIVQRCIHNSLDQNLGCYVSPERERELTT